MTNVPGYAVPYSTAPFPGLSYVTAQAAADTRISLGGGTGPGIGGEFWYDSLRPVGAPPPCSDVHTVGGYTYSSHFQMNGTFDEAPVSTSPATLAAACGTEFVIIIYRPNFNVGGGNPHCDPVTFDPPYGTIEDITMVGFGDIDTLRGGDFIGAPSHPEEQFPHAPFATLPNPLTYTSNGRAAPFTDSRFPAVLLRPTALSWTGQDPDLLSNRMFWDRTEIGDVTTRVAGYGASLDFTPEWTVTGYNPTVYPGLLPITTPPSAPDAPSSIFAGQHEHGVVFLGGD